MREALGKRYVDVDVRWKKDGTIVPNMLYWETENGTEKYEYTRCEDFGNDEIVAIARIVGVTIEEGKKAPKPIMVFNHKYFVKASEEWNESIADYYAKASYNYVIIERGQVLTWDDGNPVMLVEHGEF